MLKKVIYVDQNGFEAIYYCEEDMIDELYDELNWIEVLDVLDPNDSVVMENSTEYEVAEDDSEFYRLQREGFELSI